MPPKRAREEADPRAEKKAKIDTRGAGKTGTVFTNGMNATGQLGIHPDHTERKKPTQVKGDLVGLNIVKIAAGGMHTVAVTDAGKVYTFGCADDGASGRIKKMIPMEKSDEKVEGEKTVNGKRMRPMDDEETAAAEAAPGLVSGLGSDDVIVDCSAGDSHTLLLTNDGRVFACGVFRDDGGQFGFSDSKLEAQEFEAVTVEGCKKVVSIASGTDHCVLLGEDKKGKTQIWTFGCGGQGQLGRVPEKKSGRDPQRDNKGGAALDHEFSEQLSKRRTNIGTLRTLLVPQPIESRGLAKGKIVSIFAGDASTFAVMEDGTVWACGSNNYNQLGMTGADADVLCLYAPKQAKAFGGDVTSLASGQHHTIVTKTDGTVWTIGRGDAGQLGVLAPESSSAPSETKHLLQVQGIDGDVVGISAGTAASFVVMKDGSGYAWGFGENLQLTNGEEDDVLVPTAISGKALTDREIAHVVAGGQHTAFLLWDR